MNVEDITIGQAKEIASIFSTAHQRSNGLNSMIGQKCVIRTYSAGVWFGEIVEKEGNEVIVKNARRMWRWKAAKSISLSAVAVHGIDQSDSLIAPAVPSVWLEAIELIPASSEAITTIEGAKDAVAR